MEREYKQCPNGHYYQGGSCPYCKGNSNAGSNTSLKTEIFVSNAGANSQIPTETTDGGGTTNKTTVIDERETVGGTAGGTARSVTPPTNRTVFGDETEIEITPTGQQVEKKLYRNIRKLTGWLVTYSLDAMGIDYKLYEGRNIIGRDVDCNITVNDGMISGKHAVLLFRDGKYSLTDSQSSHGTFVNDEDIELQPRYLKDGDVIRMGETIFKFRTSF